MQRLTGAVESPGSSFAYRYDLAGNRTGVTVDGTAALTDTYDAADQVVGWTYDNAGNLTNDGTTSYSYDATNDLTKTTAGAQIDDYVYNGDGTLVSQTANGTTTNYTQDLAADQSQILAGAVGMTTTDYLYGQDTAPLAALTGGTRTWYGIDGQGSVRQSLDDSGTILGVQNYDPFGQIEAGSSLIGPFGYAGELQDPTTGQQYLRARWYQPGSGTLLGVDPALANTDQPYSYAGDDPVNGSDPSGQCTFPQGQLPGIDGSGSCAAAIQHAIVGAGGAAAGAVLNNQSQFITTLNQELAQAEVAAPEERSGAESQVLGGSGCGSPNACASIANAAYDAALQTPGHVAGSSGVVTNGHVTGLLLGTEMGTQSQISVGVFVLNGAVAVAVSVRAPGTTATLPTSECSTGAAVAGGSFAGALPAIGSIGGLGGVAGAAGEGVVEGEVVDRGYGGIAGIMIAAAIGALLGIATAAISAGLPPPDVPDPCEGPRVFCISFGARQDIALPDIAWNVARGIALGLPDELHYLGRRNPQRKLNRDAACDPKRQEKAYGHVAGGSTTCDEYPFASTAEGGARTVINEVSRTENSRQGTLLSAFYGKAFGYNGGPAAAFSVVLVP